MICQNCGTQNGNTAFCIGCGASMATSAQTASSVPAYDSTAYSTSSAYTAASVDPTVYGAPARSKGPAKLIIICAAAGVLVIALLIFLLNLGNIQARSIAKKALDAELNYNYTKIVDLVHRELTDQALEDADADRDDLNEYLEDQAEENKDEAEEEGYRFDYKILGVSDVKGDNLRDLQDYYDDEYDLRVSAAKLVEIKAYRLSHGRRTQTSFAYITVVKIGSKWYADYDDFSYSDMLEGFVAKETGYDDYDSYY